jgi:hypothetical protein
MRRSGTGKHCFLQCARTEYAAIPLIPLIEYMSCVNPKVFCTAMMSCPRQLGLQIDYSHMITPTTYKSRWRMGPTVSREGQSGRTRARRNRGRPHSGRRSQPQLSDGWLEHVQYLLHRHVGHGLSGAWLRARGGVLCSVSASARRKRGGGVVTGVSASVHGKRAGQCG